MRIERLYCKLSILKWKTHSETDGKPATQVKV